MPVVEKLYQQEPEAIPFRQPVDPDKLNIPVRQSSSFSLIQCIHAIGI